MVTKNSNNSSALRRRKKPGGFGPLPTDEPRPSSKVKRGIHRNKRKTKIYVAVSSDVQNRRYTAFLGMIARGLRLSLGNTAKQAGKQRKRS